MPGLEKVLRGILKYRKDVRPSMVKKFEKIREKPEPKAVMFSCVDSRVIITRMLQSDVGDMFVVRNAGNFVPHARLFGSDGIISGEPAVMELGCVINNIQDIAVCGHSDCKAMNTLYDMRDKLDLDTDSPLTLWLKRHGAATLTKFEQFEVHSNNVPLEFNINGKKHFEAYIDPDNEFSPADQLSQVNALLQAQNIASYSMLHNRLKSGALNIHALWFDINTGEFHIFSKEEKRFSVINEESFDRVMKFAKLGIPNN